ncbi:MAG: hypothetical protein ACOY40_17825 [Bacillota bacterium]
MDIFCLNPKNQKQVAIQVKTKRGGNQYYIPENVDEYDQPYAFVYINPDHTVEYYVVPSRDVARLSTKQRDKYLREHPHVRREQPRMLSVKSIQEFKDRWDLLGLD